MAMLLACSLSWRPCGPHELVARRSLVADRVGARLRRGRRHHGGRHAAALAAGPRRRPAGRPGAATLPPVPAAAGAAAGAVDAGVADRARQWVDRLVQYRPQWR